MLGAITQTITTTLMTVFLPVIMMAPPAPSPSGIVEPAALVETLDTVYDATPNPVTEISSSFADYYLWTSLHDYGVNRRDILMKFSYLPPFASGWSNCYGRIRIAKAYQTEGDPMYLSPAVVTTIAHETAHIKWDGKHIWIDGQEWVICSDDTSETATELRALEETALLASRGDPVARAALVHVLRKKMLVYQWVHGQNVAIYMDRDEHDRFLVWLDYVKGIQVRGPLRDTGAFDSLPVDVSAWEGGTSALDDYYLEVIGALYASRNGQVEVDGRTVHIPHLITAIQELAGP